MKVRTLIFGLLISMLFACKQAIPKETKPLVLEHLVRQPLVATAHPPALILLHGYGSNMQDLFGLSQHIPDEWLVISAQAPHQMGDNGYAWYALDFSSGQAVGQAAEAQKAQQILKEFIPQAVNRYKANPKNIVVAGFSQGAILSAALAMDSEISIQGAACFSGRLIEGASVNYQKADFSKQTIFLSHGKNDPVIAYQKATDMKAFLETRKASVRFVSDDAQHTISNLHFAEFLKWLKELSKGY